MSTKIIDGEYLLEKFQGKGGWTYVLLKEIKKNNDFNPNQERVNGKIDNHELSNIAIFSMGNEKYFIPVNAEIRKKINKNAGDKVKIALFRKEKDTNSYSELIACLEDEPKAHANFKILDTTEQQKILEWISSSKNDDIKVERITKTIDKLLISKNL